MMDNFGKKEVKQANKIMYDEQLRESETDCRLNLMENYSRATRKISFCTC